MNTVILSKYVTMITYISRFRFLFLLLPLVLFMACSKSSSPNPDPSPNPNPGGGGNTANTIEIVSMAFGTTSLTVTVGTKVTWNNKDNIAHTVTADDNSFDSGNIAAGGTYSYTFTAAGTYNYHCTIHPMMTGTIVVN